MWTGPFAYIGTQEILIIAGVVVLIFGGAKIPQLARGLGEGIREFKKSMDGTDDETNKPVPPGPAPAAKAETDEATTTAAK
jgi:sec-independent protein translocase protein TatA